MNLVQPLRKPVIKKNLKLWEVKKVVLFGSGLLGESSGGNKLNVWAEFCVLDG
jgi:hypothetical protein